MINKPTGTGNCKRILYVTTVAGTMDFFLEHVRMLLSLGAQIDIATNMTEANLNPLFKEWGAHAYNIRFSRSPFSCKNIKAYRQLRKLVTANHYDIVHTHTPVASLCARLACRNLRKDGTKVIYTAHGFHFYRGAPLKNWLIYYPAERLCAHWTDVLITINQEDYELAKLYMLARRVEYVPGVGVDVERYVDIFVDKAAKRRQLGIDENAFLLLTVGELNANKNQAVIIRALARLKNRNVHFAVAGSGVKRDNLLKLAHELGVAKQVHLLGFRTDVKELYRCADVFVFSSYREGLPVSIMEAMAAGMPVISSSNRGCRDEIIEGQGGFLLDPDNAHDFAMAICELMDWPEKRLTMGMFNQKYVERFSTKQILAVMQKIYRLNGLEH